LVTNDNSVTGIVPALITNYVMVRGRKKVNDLGFALVTPLGTYDDGDGHLTLLLRCRFGNRNVRELYSPMSESPTDNHQSRW
jgi:hypothetical protein